jgi:hypothetical protein
MACPPPDVVKSLDSCATRAEAKSRARDQRKAPAGRDTPGYIEVDGATMTTKLARLPRFPM